MDVTEARKWLDDINTRRAGTRDAEAITAIIAELDRHRARPSIDQARGALGWLLSHWWGDEGDTSGDMPYEYEMAREILGEGLVDQLGQMVGDQPQETGETTTEWAALWPDMPADQQIDDNLDGSRRYAERVTRHYPQTRLVSREVRRGPWAEVSS